MDEFTIDINVPLEQSLVRVLKERICAIGEHVRHGEDLNEVIHETRRSIKRIRGILKMIRDEIGFSSYYRENIFYRDLSRRMAAPRDSFVMLNTLETIRTRDVALIPAGTHQILKELISGQLSAEMDRFHNETGGMDQLLTELSAGMERIGHYCLLRNRYVIVKKGIRRTYRRGRKQQARLQDFFEMELLHEYRKNSKYLQFQMELIRPIYMKILKAYSGSLDKHTELLGEIRDTGRLLDFIEGEATGKIPPQQQKKICRGIREMMMPLLENALDSSRYIYAEKPKALTRRIGTYWQQAYRQNQ